MPIFISLTREPIIYFSFLHFYCMCVCVLHFICLAKFNKNFVFSPDLALGTLGFMSIRKLIIYGEIGLKCCHKAT